MRAHSIARAVRPVDEPVEIVDSRQITDAVGSVRQPRPRESIDPMDEELGVGQIEVADLPAQFGPSAVLLDVREDDEWQRGHAADAQHIPMGDIPARIGEIDQDAQLFLVCHAGGRSLRVAKYLARNGFEPLNVNGGMLAWAGSGRPVITDDGGTGTI